MRKRNFRARLLRWPMFWWLPIVAGVYLVYVIFGVPHVIWSYAYLDNGTRSPLVERHYTRCTFIWFYPGQSVTVPATNGKCGWIKFAHLKRS